MWLNNNYIFTRAYSQSWRCISYTHLDMCIYIYIYIYTHMIFRLIKQTHPRLSGIPGICILGVIHTDMVDKHVFNEWHMYKHMYIYIYIHEYMACVDKLVNINRITIGLVVITFFLGFPQDSLWLVAKFCTSHRKHFF